MAKMLEEQPCEPRLQGPLDQHLLRPSDGSSPRPFLIVPGEKLCLVGDSPAALQLTDKVVPLAAQPQKLISAELQMLSMGAVLAIKNHFDRALRYHVVIKAPNEKPKSTTVCPLRANLVGIEHWPFAVELIAFGGFAPVPAGEPLDCR
jgi:hypothetical protein